MSNKSVKKIVLVFLLFFLCPAQVFAFWVWTPQAKKWVNPRYAVKDTPEQQFQYALSLVDAKDYLKARQEFKKILQHFPHSPQAPQAQFYLGVCEENLNNFYKSFQEYQKAVENYPQLERLAEAIDRQYYLGEIFFGKKKKVAGLEFGPDYEKALEIFRQVVANSPYSTYADSAQHKIGLCLKYNLEYEQAIKEFEKVAENYPYSSYLAASRFEIADCKYKLSGQANNYDAQLIDSSIEAFSNFIQESPDSEQAKEAKKIVEQLRDKKAASLFKTAQFYEEQGKVEAAKIYYQDIAANYQDTIWAAKAIAKIEERKKK